MLRVSAGFLSAFFRLLCSLFNHSPQKPGQIPPPLLYCMQENTEKRRDLMKFTLEPADNEELEIIIRGNLSDPHVPQIIAALKPLCI